jgi:hypothetical protein
MTARRIDRALEQFRAGTRDLYTEDGQKLYSDEEHERRMDVLLEEFDRERDSVVADADRTIEKTEPTIALEHRDLSDSLTTTELECANAKRSYVEDDVRTLPLETLLKRVAAAQAAGDKPTMFLYARTLHRRIEAEFETGIFPDQAARLERLASELAQAVRGPGARLIHFE